MAREAAITINPNVSVNREAITPTVIKLGRLIVTIFSEFMALALSAAGKSCPGKCPLRATYLQQKQRARYNWALYAY